VSRRMGDEEIRGLDCGGAVVRSTMPHSQNFAWHRADRKSWRTSLERLDYIRVAFEVRGLLRLRRCDLAIQPKILVPT
jgi:hypothetical protein